MCTAVVSNPTAGARWQDGTMQGQE